VRIQKNRLTLVLTCTVALLFLIPSLLHFYTRVESWEPRNLDDDPVTNWERRIEPLKADLPKNGEIGYLSEWDLPGWDGSQSDMDNEYRLTQYALAPRLLVRGHRFAYVVANLADPADVQSLKDQFGLREIRGYGFGIYLFAGQEN